MKVFVGTGSVTYAHKANSVLNKLNIKNSVVKKQVTSSFEGCGYGVEVTSDDPDKILEILTAAGVKVNSVSKE